MLTISACILAVAVIGGLVLAAAWLAEKPPNRWLRLVSIAHGIAAAGGTALLAAVIFRGAPDGQGLGHLASWFLLAALAGGGFVVLAQLRGRRPSGLAVALHATVGFAGFVVLIAYRGIAG